VRPDVITHMTNFMDHVNSAKDLMTFGAETIASSILLDNYRPRMHC
jgi:hypothetical protein